jgi:hypothetical protein
MKLQGVENAVGWGRGVLRLVRCVVVDFHERAPLDKAAPIAAFAAVPLRQAERARIAKRPKRSGGRSRRSGA